MIWRKMNNCVSKTHIDKLGGGVQYKLCATPRPLFKRNISVADCIYLLRTIKINDDIECRYV